MQHLIRLKCTDAILLLQKVIRLFSSGDIVRNDNSNTKPTGQAGPLTGDVW